MDPLNEKIAQPPSQTGDGPTARAMRFPNLSSAGRDLAVKLEAYGGREDVVVLGIALGGAPVAFEVAERLGLPLDFVIIRRLLAPHGPGSQLCAVSAAGSLVIDEELMPRPASPVSAFDHFASEALDQLARRERDCRGERTATNITGKTILLVDCGIRSGLTMQAAIRALRTMEPTGIIAAVPVAAPESRTVIEAIADDMICLEWPRPFGNTGMWYADFSRPGDDQVSELLDRAALARASRLSVET